MPDAPLLIAEIGGLILVLAFVARLSGRLGLTPIPLYLLAGLAFGEGGVYPLLTAGTFVGAAGEIGAILLLLMVGLEYTVDEFRTTMREAAPAGVMDVVLNFVPGALCGLLLGFGPLGAVLLGGVTLTTSSGVMAKMLHDLGRLGNRETPVVLSIAVIEDMIMALYLPVVAVAASGGDLATGAVNVLAAIAVVVLFLVAAVAFGERISRLLESPSDEVLLLSILGVTLVAAGVAQMFQVSAAIAAFLVGIGLSGDVAERARQVLTPLRDLFAAVFFVLFGLRLDPADIPSVAAIAVGLAAVTGATKVATGWWAARRAGIGPRGRRRAGAALVPRGEFSVLIAGVAVETGAEPRLGPLAAVYVMVLAFAGPALARWIDPGPPGRPAPRPEPAPDPAPEAEYWMQ